MKLINYAIIVLTMYVTINADLGPIRYGGDATVIVDPTTITQPGNYRLSRDIAGTINIAADNVHLDLNNKQITATSYAITITAHQNITIENGVLSNATQAAMFINTCSNIRVENVDFLNSVTGLFVLTTTCLIVNGCSLMGNSNNAVTLNNCNNNSLSNSFIKFNTISGENGKLVNIQETFNVQFDSISVTDNDLSLNDVVVLKNTSNMQIINSQFNNNINVGIIINIQSSNPLFISACEFNKNATSEIISVNDFIVTITQGSLIQECRFNENTCLSVLAVGGFGYTIRNCEAIGNNSGGQLFIFYALPQSQSVRFVNCIANDNTALNNIIPFFNASLRSENLQ